MPLTEKDRAVAVALLERSDMESVPLWRAEVEVRRTMSPGKPKEGTLSMHTLQAMLRFGRKAELEAMPASVFPWPMLADMLESGRALV
jgi:hypothetical protein